MIAIMFCNIILRVRYKEYKGYELRKVCSTNTHDRQGEGRYQQILEKQKQTRFENKKGNMIMVTVEKAEFGQLNDKRYVMTDGISSLPYGHKDLEYIENFKCETL